MTDKAKHILTHTRQSPHLKGVDTKVSHGHGTILLSVPAHNEEDAHKALQVIGTGGLGTSLTETYLGLALPKIRRDYYARLRAAEAEISARQLSLSAKLQNPAEYRSFVEWAAGKRTSIARLYRIPSGLGAVVGGEVRDNLKYGLGGRTPQNLINRNMKAGLSETEALAKVLATVDKPNPAVTEAVFRGAKYLKAGGAVFFVGGVGLSGYEIYKASPKDRPELIKKEVITTGGSMVATDLAVGVAFMLGATGVGLIAVGVIAGVAAAYGAEKLYYAHQHAAAVSHFKHAGVIDAAALRRSTH